VHVIVVGCGRVGSSLSLRLLQKGHSVTIIDKLESAFRRLPADFSGQKLVGFGFDKEILVEAGAERAGALAAVTSGDNSNILTARIARETFEIPKVVARIYDPRRAEIYQRLGIPTVATVTWTTDQVMRRLIDDELNIQWSDPTGKLRLVEKVLPEQWIGKKFKDLEEKFGFKIIAVNRSGSTFIPSINTTTGQEDDILYVVLEDSDKELLIESNLRPDLPGAEQ
jgi:trk system potassium uptake protein TrkA